MNNIGFGIMCFGDDYYYRGAMEKIKNIVKKGFNCCILTDDATKFCEIHDYHYKVHYLEYDREFKSYYDKILLVKHILKYHDICILLDADAHITDYSFLNDLKTYKFKEGITYPDVLLNHPEKKQFISEINMSSKEWKYYHDYAKSQLNNFGELELIWEYFMVFNQNGFNQKEFYLNYEKLQIAKEFGDLSFNKKVNGSGIDVSAAGEGLSIAIASKLSEMPCERDVGLYNLIKDKLSSISKKYTRKEFWPEWMK